ncbi:aminotransferase class I/II-fold pyridoxal phosphate-dependent enzyme [uncultured Roseibium sp.]|uniref:aminotransferase class I/II-fold pyridoxal phosphate-dependent enzyme n=1 Tax=uncultured Roseibium sp. TaxID=1936171 RepID=UPI0032174658
MHLKAAIVEVVNAARDREGLIPLWVGEGNLPTPEFICNAAKASMDAGETFYTHQRGIPELREALAGYHRDLYRKPFSMDQFFVTGSGMQAMQIAVQCVCGGRATRWCSQAQPGRTWPPVVGIMGGRAVPVTMDHDDAGWSLDPQKLFDAVTPQTRAIYLNSPSNPTGWVADRQLLTTILEEARRNRGLWILADEVYGRFSYQGAGAGSLLQRDCRPGRQDPVSSIRFPRTGP